MKKISTLLLALLTGCIATTQYQYNTNTNTNTNTKTKTNEIQMGLLTPSGKLEIADPSWKLVWSDDFNGQANTPPDPSKWNHATGGNGWGNNELEYYTDRIENAHLTGDGHLAIRAQREDYQGMQYTSARLTTAKKFEFTYGRVEARIMIPKTQGIWSAFWMLGANIQEVGWPNCGEIDIMENIGREPKTNHGSMHGPGYHSSHPMTGTFSLPLLRRSLLSDTYHIYSVEWEPNVVRFYVDNMLYHTKTPQDMPRGSTWVFNDHPFYIMLNVAVGGNMPGNPDGRTILPKEMMIDYVRVYQR